MNDTIYRQAALDAFGLSEKTRKYGGDHSGYDTRMLYEIQDVLEGLPSAQPERDKGKWGADGECPFCGYLRQWDDDNFCANCGADMRGESDD